MRTRIHRQMLSLALRDKMIKSVITFKKCAYPCLVNHQNTTCTHVLMFWLVHFTMVHAFSVSGIILYYEHEILILFFRSILYLYTVRIISLFLLECSQYLIYNRNHLIYVFLCNHKWRYHTKYIAAC